MPWRPRDGRSLRRRPRPRGSSGPWRQQSPDCVSSGSRRELVPMPSPSGAPWRQPPRLWRRLRGTSAARRPREGPEWQFSGGSSTESLPPGRRSTWTRRTLGAARVADAGSASGRPQKDQKGLPKGFPVGRPLGYLQQSGWRTPPASPQAHGLKVVAPGAGRGGEDNTPPGSGGEDPPPPYRSRESSP